MEILIVSGDRSTPEGRPINLGDAFLTDSLIQALELLGHSVQAVDFGAGGHIRNDRVCLTGFRQLVSAAAGVDLVILGGGTLLQDDTMHGLHGMPRLVAATSAAAHLARTRMVGFGLGCDVVSRPAAKWLLRAGVAGRRIAVRDEQSQFNLQKLVGRQPRLAADASLLGTAGRTIRSGPRGGTLVSLTWHEAAALDLQAFSTLETLGGPLRFVQMSQWGDYEDARTLTRDVRESFAQITSGLTVHGMWSLYVGAANVIASRMHALYAGLLSDCGLVAVGNIPKVRSFAQEFEIPWRETVADLVSNPPTPRRGSKVAVELARSRAQGELVQLLEEQMSADAWSRRPDHRQADHATVDNDPRFV